MKTFIKDLIERAVKTFAQVMLGYIGVEGVGSGDVNWAKALSVAGLATLASILTSIASRSVGNNNSASLIEK